MGIEVYVLSKIFPAWGYYEEGTCGADNYCPSEEKCEGCVVRIFPDDGLFSELPASGLYYGCGHLSRTVAKSLIRWTGYDIGEGMTFSTENLRIMLEKMKKVVKWMGLEESVNEEFAPEKDDLMVAFESMDAKSQKAEYKRIVEIALRERGSGIRRST